MTIPSHQDRELLEKDNRVTIRPIRPTDVLLERDFIMSLSPQSRRYRFLDSIATPSRKLIEDLTNVDGATEAAFIALATVGGLQREIGVARMSAVGADRAEFAVAVSDDWQRKGIGSRLTRCVIEAARRRGILSLFSIDSADNGPMKGFASHLGFSRTQSPDDPIEVVHTLRLDEGPPGTRGPSARPRLHA